LAGNAQERRRRGRAVWGGGRGRRGERWYIKLGGRGTNGGDQRPTAVVWVLCIQPRP
jgi:hypothetical protein